MRKPLGMFLNAETKDHQHDAKLLALLLLIIAVWRETGNYCFVYLSESFNFVFVSLFLASEPVFYNSSVILVYYNHANNWFHLQAEFLMRSTRWTKRQRGNCLTRI